MNRAIVTGASGFIGSALVQELLSAHVEVYAVVRRDSLKKDVLKPVPGLTIIECNMDEYYTLRERICTPSIDVFYHLAWEGSAGPLRSDVQIQLNNVKYTVDAVKTAKELHCGCFCGAGSIMEIEAGCFIPQNGSRPSKTSIYSSAKLAAHYMAKSIAADLGIPFIWGMISNAFGVGEISPRFVNTTIRKFMHEFEVDFTEGCQLYDFVYISDMAHAFYLLGLSGIPFSTYYIGSGQPRHLREYIEIMRDCITPNVILRFGSIPYNGVCLPIETFDTSKLLSDTGFRPVISFDEGIRRTACWLKNMEENHCDDTEI